MVASALRGKFMRLAIHVLAMCASFHECVLVEEPGMIA